VSTSVVARRRLRVTGVVQGVGFRPFVHHLATELGLAGFVGNDAAGVFLEIEGPEPLLDELARRLVTDAPPLARVDAVHAERVAPGGETGFRIVASAAGAGGVTLVPPDVATCERCLAEVDDPGDRRFRYPFTNCTACGPRFTIIRALPYDRPATTMAAFELCAACAAEYHDPGNRRYHAQPVACPACGPQVVFERDGELIEGTDPVLAAVHASLARGEVVAVKGIGGYHLACDARCDRALRTLRERKGRVDKPFAVLVADLAAARRIAEVDGTEASALTSPARPIVLLRRRPDAALSPLVAPGNPLVGVMLPYSPLHHLLLRSVPGSPAPVPEVLVLTSGNVSEEPICTDDAEAAVRLAGLADAVCRHDRPIHVPCDDSVVRVVAGEVQPIRRSRGYAPLPVDLPAELAPTLAVGGELKNTFCLAAGRHAWMSQHLGDMGNLETLRAFERSVEQFVEMYGMEPEVLAVDAHPGYLTHRWAREHAGGRPLVQVQHHHAHVASVMAEHGLDGSERVIGVAFDGTGFGPTADGRLAIWGGEVLVADYDGFDRVAHLAELPLPGGDAAVRHPCRVALAYLTAARIHPDERVPAVAACDEVERRIVVRQVERHVGCVPTTSMGRLFDAVSSLLGVRHRATYEAQAAIELEALAAEAEAAGRGVPLRFGDRPDGALDPVPVLRAIVEQMRSGTDPAALALGFHQAVAEAVTARVVAVRAGGGPNMVALTGGVFQNAVLTRLLRSRLDEVGFGVLTHRLVPPNDGGIALGQAMIAGRRRW
jgi:hydrogenase maturation protein HypF